MDVEKASFLKWFLEFVQADLDHMPRVDVAKLIVETNFALDGIVGGWKFAASMLVMQSASRNREEALESFLPIRGKEALTKIHKELRTFFSQMMENIEKVDAYDGEPLEAGTFDEKSLWIAEFDSQFSIGLRIQARLFGESELDESGTRVEFSQTFADPDEIQEAPFRLSIRAKNPADMLKFQFLSALVGFSRNTIKECENCGRFFLRFRKRERKYCSKTCSSKKKGRERWEDLKKDSATYKATLKEAADRAHAHYVKKKQRETPDSVPKRRPLKYKEQED